MIGHEPSAEAMTGKNSYLSFISKKEVNTPNDVRPLDLLCLFTNWQLQLQADKNCPTIMP